MIAVGIGERAAVIALVVHVNARIGQRRHPGGTPVHRPIRAAGAPAHVGFGGQRPFRDECETPVVGRVGGGIGADGANGKKVLPVCSGETRARPGGHLELKHAVARGHRKAARPDFRVVIDGDGVGIGVEEIDVGGIAVRRGANGRIVSVVPGLDRIQREPVAGIAGADVADDEVGLHGLCGRDAPALLDAAVDQVGFALIQHHGRGAHAVAVRIDGQKGVVLRGHHDHPDIFEQAVRHVLSHRADVVRSVIQRGQNPDRPGKHRSGVHRPRGARNHQRLGRGNVVAGIP